MSTSNEDQFSGSWWSPQDSGAAYAIREAAAFANPEAQHKAIAGLDHLARRIAYLTGLAVGQSQWRESMEAMFTEIGDQLSMLRALASRPEKPKPKPKPKPKKRKRS